VTTTLDERVAAAESAVVALSLRRTWARKVERVLLHPEGGEEEENNDDDVGHSYILAKYSVDRRFRGVDPSI
jgi:cob(I)alamin adenosyltransferase